MIEFYVTAKNGGSFMWTLNPHDHNQNSPNSKLAFVWNLEIFKESNA